ncbi:uncharacterized protein LOC123316585 [Coccinella septempunctata]|uniref:uncharacterized protein LOC123316585 n=1 Tax=Coccinella septempunctata TaxID=41139 RepID=UPI001D08C815|nr:uncharacterized protein LOC123316585 [Coccinella septempunctata]
MVSMRILWTMFIVFICVEAQREYHRIHVPTRIKTIYHTKIIKVPEHHHYIHEKEKLVPVVSHHHHSSHHKSSSYTDVDVEESKLEYHQAADNYQPLDEDDFELDSYRIASDYLPSYKKTPKIHHKRKKPRPLRVKHKIIKLPPI